MSEKPSEEDKGIDGSMPSDENKLIARMRTNTENQGRRTGTRPYRRTRMKVLKIRPKEGPEKPS